MTWTDARGASLASAGERRKVQLQVERPRVLFDVADVAKAKARTEGEDLKTVMREVGVIGPPSIVFFN